MAKFTGAQMRRIDELLNSEFEDATVEDIELYGDWMVERAKTNEEFEAIRKYWADEYEVTSQLAQQQAQAAENTLNMLAEKAIARYERFDDGQ